MNYKWLLSGVVLGALGLWITSFTMEATNTEQFCLSCHEMSIPKERLATTLHGNNKHGLQASCSDCHVPKPLLPKLVRKIQAAREVWGHLAGTIDSPEKYTAYRDVMRTRELDRMQANDSAECRNCHNVQQWDLTAQSRSARNKHEDMSNEAKTCVNCHDDVAHPLDDGTDELFGLTSNH